MIEFLGGRASERKSRLFAAACCRRLLGLITDRHCRKALGVVERFADGEVTAEKLSYARGDARRAGHAPYRRADESSEGSAMFAVARACEADIMLAVEAASFAAGCEAFLPPPLQLGYDEARREQARLLRDMFLHPASRRAWTDRWRSPDVVSLALGVYSDRAFDRLPILADALEEAGATGDILSHLRTPGPHVRGCWALDLILGKS
jgi:hypothetical protein